MQTIKKCILLFFFTAFISVNSFGQGCSDAGVCTINTFKPDAEDTIPSKANQIKSGIAYGSADHQINVFGVYLNYNRQLNEQISSDIKLTTLLQSGNGINTYGLSDVFWNLNYSADKIRLVLGTKIPLNDGNKTENGMPLPMDYQSSLGTFDLIAGIGFKLGKLDLVAALQQPLTQNKNKFIAEIYPREHLFSDFHTTNNYKRSGDIMLRISYPIFPGENIKLTPGLLPIYHISNDKYTGLDGIEREINGSQGLTLNGNLFIDYFINRFNIVQLSIGAPFVVRETRPDGLTRGFVINLEYSVGF